MDIYQRITDRMIEIIESGQCPPWHQPWKRSGGIPVNAATDRPYRGINQVVLWAEAQIRGFPVGRWLTYRQAHQMGGHVRKGESGTWVVFWKFIDRPVLDDDGREILDGEGSPRIDRFPVARGYVVFNVAQCDGLPPEAFGKDEEVIGGWDPLEHADHVVHSSGARIEHAGDDAFYAPGQDVIHMPDTDRFPSAQAYYSTLYHELVHWTGHESRLARSFGNRFGDRAYAFEELVAELGAAFLCARTGIDSVPREDHAGYLKSWLAVLKRDRKALFSAAGHASRASDFLLDLASLDSADRQAV